ncbi:TetR/AcrR family transcriptional regulator [Kribbella sp. NPDC023972]|uniref:TetR/AcrR family transcriptional regulator n=1 Tax=Kribbella sp. NPDC023972 TaxID=3154795 RepID=UPI0034010D78
MATMISQAAPGRASARRLATVEEALDHAQAIVAEQGAGAVTVSEIARRMGMRAPSLYKYFPSLHAIYDGLFARGNVQLAQYIDDALHGCEPGLDCLLEGQRAFIRWSTREVGLAPLLLWRPIPGFEPSADSYAPAQALWQRGRDELRTAVHRHQLIKAADSDEAMRMLTAAIAGVSSQQLANQPGARFEDGLFTSLTEEVLDMFVSHYSAPERKVRR